jgi:hypothetical protein
MQPPQSQNNSERPHRRVQVNTRNESLAPEQVEALRAQRATQLTNSDLTEDNTEPRRFDPRTSTRPVINPTKPNLDDVAAAFAAAGQPMQVKKVITNNSGGSNPPEFTRNRVVAPEVALNNPRIEQPISGNPLSFRAVLPSNEVFYQHQQLELRPLEVPEYAKLYRARAENDESLLIDTIDAVCSIDVRNLTPKDFRYLMYQIRINSALKSPYELSYTSIYGNRCKFTVNNTTLTTKVLDATPEEYAEWQTKGLAMPTVRDLEEYNIIKSRLIGAEGEFLWSKAKYLRDGKNVEDKIRRLKAIPPNFIFEEIEQFAKRFEDYGVIESVQLEDNQFNPELALSKLHTDLRLLERSLHNQSLSPTTVELMLERQTNLLAEINRLSAAIDAGEAAPLRETIPFSIEIADFFPTI